MHLNADQNVCQNSIFRNSAEEGKLPVVILKVPQLVNGDDEFLLGLNEILDELHPMSDHGPLSGILQYGHS